MTGQEVPTSSVGVKVSTGYDRLDRILRGGFLRGSAVALSAPASDEVPILLRNFLTATDGGGVLICRSLSFVPSIANQVQRIKILVCSDRPPPQSQNVVPCRGIANLTELNLAISEVLSDFHPNRVAIGILSDILLRHRALQTRKWLTELLDRLRAKNVTTLAVINPNMHTREEVEALVDLFDGNLQILEKGIDGELVKVLHAKWMHGLEIVDRELSLADLTLEKRPSPPAHPPFKEPRWLTPLVNRTEELAKIESALGEALSLKTSVVGIQGEAGAGKTRLMRELALRAQSRSIRVLVGRATEDRLPYQPWIEVIRAGMSETEPETIRKKLGSYVSDIAKLVPDVADKIRLAPSAVKISEEQDKIRLFDAVTKLLTTISGGIPLILMFDDMHWADQASLSLLEYFARNSSGLPILAICAYRGEDVRSDNPLYKTLMELNRNRILEVVTLRNLSREDAAILISEVFGDMQISAEFSDLVYQRTGGNPFFIEEVLRSFVEQERIYRTEKGWDRKPIQELVIPETVKSIIRSRINKLGVHVLDLLQWAAVIGFEFQLDILSKASRTGEDVVLESSEAAMFAGLISETQKDRFRFVDSRIREIILDELSRSRKARYHMKIGEVMESTYSKSLERHAELVAHHFSEGGDSERGIRYSLMAADWSSSIHAYEQSISNFKRALDLIDLEGGREKEKAVILEKLGGSYYFAGQLRNSIRAYEEAIEILDKLGDHRACARICLSLANTAWTTTPIGRGVREARRILARGLQYLEDQPESYEAATIHSRLGSTYAVLDENEEAIACAEKATRIGERTKNYRAVADALAIKGNFLADTGRLDEGLPLIQQAFELALKTEDYYTAEMSLMNLSVYTYQRDLARAHDLALRLLDLSERTNYITAQARDLAWLSYLDWLGGRWEKANEELQKGLGIRRKLGLSDLPFLHQRALYSIAVGDLDSAEEDLREALKSLEQEMKITSIVKIRLATATLKLERGMQEEALKHLEECVKAFREMEFTTEPLHHVEALMYLSQLYSDRRDFERAREVSDWAMRISEQLRSDAGLAMALQARAGVLSASGDIKGAQESLLKSISLWKKAGWPYYLSKAQAAYYGIVEETSPREARNMMEEATRTFRGLGAKRDLERMLDATK